MPGPLSLPRSLLIQSHEDFVRDVEEGLTGEDVVSRGDGDDIIHLVARHAVYDINAVAGLHLLDVDEGVADSDVVNALLQLLIDIGDTRVSDVVAVRLASEAEAQHTVLSDYSVRRLCLISLYTILLCLKKYVYSVYAVIEP